MFEGLQKYFAIKGVRWGATLVAGSVVGFLGDHTQVAGWITQGCASISDPVKLSGFLTAAGTAGVTLFFALKDVVSTNAKVVTAAVTGSVAAVNDAGVRAATVAAVKSGELAAPSAPAPNLDDLIAARQAAARGG